MTEEVKTEAEKGQEQMDAANLFREEIYTDRKIGVIRCLVPVTADGKVDESRKVIYTGEAQIMTQMGALPISFDIEADNLAAAVANYREAAKAGVEKTMNCAAQPQARLWFRVSPASRLLKVPAAAV